MKNRFSTADVAAEVACLKRIEGFRISNVYDVSSKVYLFKLAKSGGEDGETEKQMLILESGTRFHLSKYSRDKPNTPSNFCLKLRKHIRSKRIERVEQVGIDRIVDFTIGSGPAKHHLILELYSQGNVILTDADYKVLTLLRSHRDDENEFAIMANHPYPIGQSRTRGVVTVEGFAELQRANLGGTLKAVASKAISYGPQIAEHCLHLSGLDPRVKLEQELDLEQAETLVSNLNQVSADLAFAGPQVPKGYIFLKGVQEGGGDGAGAGGKNAAAPQKFYESFEPFLTKQSEAKPCQSYDSFNDAVDEFYSSIECQKQEVSNIKEKKQISGKLEKIKADQEARIEGLRSQVISSNKKAQLIEYNLESVDAAINAVNEAIASGFDWKELDQMIRSEQEAGNPVAQLVHSLQLERNAITLQIRNNLDDFENEEENALQCVAVDLGMTAHANACALYQQRKKHEKKETKTIEASQKALKEAEKNATSQMKKLKVTPGFKVTRKQLWFEKFDWFISSENYLVVSGRDAQQNETIVKRYLTKHDIYVHADIHGAASCVIRNRVDGGAIPPATLLQAGTFCVCHSQAWNSKFTTGSWWVYSDQVSKTAPSGEYLTTGSFMIRGKKNFLQPTQLLMGFTVLFKLDKDSVEAHLGERASKYKMEGGSSDRSGTRGEGAGDDDLDHIEEVEGAGDGGDSESEGQGDGKDVEEEAAAGASEDSLLDLLDTSVALARPEGEEIYEQVGEVSRHKSNAERARNEERKRAEREKEKEMVAQAQKQKQGKVRGKHGKKKKMKKYADQDDEDRALAMMLLGSAGKKGGKGVNKEAAAGPKGEEDAGKSQPPAKEQKAPKGDAAGSREREDGKDSGPVSEAASEGRPKKAEAKMSDPAEQAGGPAGQDRSGKGASQEEGEGAGAAAAEEGEKEDADVDILNSLTGLPKEEDIMLFCLPMCAPYSAIQNYKYKVKLTPGNMKRGKASKSAIEMILGGQGGLPPREYSMIRGMPDQEVVACMLGNSRPAIAGAKVPQNRKIVKAKRRGRGKKKR